MKLEFKAYKREVISGSTSGFGHEPQIIIPHDKTEKEINKSSETEAHLQMIEIPDWEIRRMRCYAEN